ncbi:MAG TPA: Bax inhibitor-1 family protein [Planctomycetota bacterium]|nr:Bax inhibitor-1 family protein [Planctomycetota bacterium]
MNYVENYQYGTVVANAAADERADFIRKAYLHLTGAVVAFAVIVTYLVQSDLAARIAVALFSNKYGVLIVMLAFVGISWIANSWAMSATSKAMQYAGLGLYTVAEAVIMCPLIYIAHKHFPGTVPAAAVISLAMFGGLTFIVFITGKDFSFLRGILWLGGLIALGLIVCSLIFGFQLGIAFTVAMIGLCCGYILYDTSNVIHHYRVGQHVAAGLALFASVALLFWYVLRLLMALKRE